jgi:hypothetical protein
MNTFFPIDLVFTETAFKREAYLTYDDQDLVLFRTRMADIGVYPGQVEWNKGEVDKLFQEMKEFAKDSDQ